MVRVDKLYNIMWENGVATVVVILFVDPSKIISCGCMQIMCNMRKGKLQLYYLQLTGFVYWDGEI